MGNLNTLSSQISTLLNTVQLSSSSAFAEVTEYPSNKFSGYPAASITPSEVASDYATVAQNQRAYGFMVELYETIDQETWATAFSTMRDLVDGVLDILDKSIDLNGACNFLRAVPMQWTVEEAGQGLALVAAIHVIAIKDVPVH